MKKKKNDKIHSGWQIEFWRKRKMPLKSRDIEHRRRERERGGDFLSGSELDEKERVYYAVRIKQVDQIKSVSKERNKNPATRCH